MSTNVHSRRSPPEALDSSQPQITVCESCPGKAIFLEAENTDGWIASDLTVDVKR